VDRDSFKLSFRTVNQADFQLKEIGIRAEIKLKISSTWLQLMGWAGFALVQLHQVRIPWVWDI
jgi:hypothetical protein